MFDDERKERLGIGKPGELIIRDPDQDLWVRLPPAPSHNSELLLLHLVRQTAQIVRSYHLLKTQLL